MKRVVAIAAPTPFARRLHQSARHRIVMHVTDLFRALLRREHVEVVKAALPNVSLTISLFRPEITLFRTGAHPPQDLPGVRCLMSCTTPDGSPGSGSEINRWPCSGMTT